MPNRCARDFNPESLRKERLRASERLRDDRVGSLASQFESGPERYYRQKKTRMDQQWSGSRQSLSRTERAKSGLPVVVLQI